MAILKPHAFVREILIDKNSRHSTNLNVIRANPRQNLLRCTYSWGRNGNATRNKP